MNERTPMGNPLANGLRQEFSDNYHAARRRMERGVFEPPAPRVRTAYVGAGFWKIFTATFLGASMAVGASLLAAVTLDPVLVYNAAEFLRECVRP